MHSPDRFSVELIATDDLLTTNICLWWRGSENSVHYRVFNRETRVDVMAAPGTAA